MKIDGNGEEREKRLLVSHLENNRPERKLNNNMNEESQLWHLKWNYSVSKVNNMFLNAVASIFRRAVIERAEFRPKSEKIRWATVNQNTSRIYCEPDESLGPNSFVGLSPCRSGLIHWASGPVRMIGKQKQTHCLWSRRSIVSACVDIYSLRPKFTLFHWNDVIVTSES